MQRERPVVMTIAGFDPSGGAGLLADCKTFEQLQVYGVAVNTGNTIQTATKFSSIKWSPVEEVKETINTLLSAYPIGVVKTGIVPSLDFLREVLQCIKAKNEQIKIVVDPVIKSSTGFDFMNELNQHTLNAVLNHTSLLTPNAQEVVRLTGIPAIHDATRTLAKLCPVLLKGGHNNENPGTDYLYATEKVIEIPASGKTVYEKHGSGCVLSAAIAAHLAIGESLENACRKAKVYAENFLASNQTLNGYHHV